jgi:3-phenylpropionate/trans-cinnamate dioxygenase ferredoxin subunit
VRAVHDTCTHQQQSLHEGAVDGDTLVCAAHAATFDLSTGDSVGVPEVAAVPMYACKVEDDAVLVDVDALLNEAEPG